VIVCAFSDGLLHAGSRTGDTLDVAAVLTDLWHARPSAQALADGLLTRALAADDQRPVDNTSIAVLHIREGEGTGPRYLRIEMPVPDV
jgi:hypothetical protein